MPFSINQRFPMQLQQEQIHKADHFQTSHSAIGRAIYKLGRFLTIPIAREANIATKLIGKQQRPGKVAGDMTEQKLRNFRLEFGLAIIPAFALAILGYPLRLLGSLFKDQMGLISNEAVKPKVYNENEGLHLMTYNVGLMPKYIRNLNDLRSSNTRAEEIGEVINKQKGAFQPDVVCFQEVFDIDATGILCNKLKDSYHHVLHSIAPNETGLNSGLCVASKYPIKEVNFRPFTDLSAEDALANKGLLRIVLDLGQGKTAVVYSTHLQAKGSEKYAEIRQNEIKQIRNWIKEDQSGDASSHVGIFLVGDFNVANRIDDTGADSQEYKKALETLGEEFHDPFYDDHDKATEKRNNGRPFFLFKDRGTNRTLEEPDASWHEGANPAQGQDRAQWGNNNWYQTQKTYSKCIYDHQFIYNPDGKSDLTGKAEIRHLGGNLKLSSGLSDHLPVSTIYKKAMGARG